MKHFIIPADLLGGVIRYLSSRPFAEVAEAVPALQGLPEASAAPQPAWEALAACIRSEQVPYQDVAKIMEADPAFAEWYRSNAA